MRWEYVTVISSSVHRADGTLVKSELSELHYSDGTTEDCSGESLITLAGRLGNVGWEMVTPEWYKRSS